MLPFILVLLTMLLPKAAAPKVGAQMKTPKKIKAPSASKDPSKRIVKNIKRSIVNNEVTELMSYDEKLVRQVILSIACPLDCPPVRLGAAQGSKESALAHLWQKLPATFGTLTTTGSLTDFVLFLFRDPYRYCVTLMPATLGFLYTSPPVVLTNVAGMPAYQDVPVAYLLNTPDVAHQNSPHGVALFCGTDGLSPKRYFWCGTNNIMTITNQSALSLSVQIFQWANGVTTLFQVTGCAGNTYSAITIPNPGYYSLAVAGASGSATSVQLYVSVGLPNGANLPQFGHLTLPGLFQNTASSTAIKLYSAACKITENAADLYNEGKLVAVQIPAGELWLNVVGAGSPYATLSSMADAQTFAAKTGCYSFLKPTQPADVNFIEFPTTTGTAIQTDATFQLVPGSDFLGFAGFVTNTTGQDFEITIGSNIEYVTGDIWRDTELPSISPEIVTDGLFRLSGVPQHHENPLHLSDITDWIADKVSGVYNWVKGNAGTIASVASAAAPFFL